MEKITIKGSKFALPEDMCVSCSGLPAPDTHIVVSYATKGYRKNFEFPACEHCAVLHRKFWKRSLWIITTLMVVTIAAGITIFLLLSGTFQNSFRGFEGPADTFLWLVSILVLGAIFFLCAKFGEALAIRSLGDPSPPLKVVRISSITPELSWTFHFENDNYAMKFRALNQGILKGANKPASIGG